MCWIVSARKCGKYFTLFHFSRWCLCFWMAEPEKPEPRQSCAFFYLTKMEGINTEPCEFQVRDEREKRPWVFSGTPPFIPSAFSPAFSSCSLTTSFMCCHWGSPSPISWTFTSPSGLLPVLYLVILILTWSSAACSGGGDETKEGQNKNSSAQKPVKQRHRMEEVRAKTWKQQHLHVSQVWFDYFCLDSITEYRKIRVIRPHREKKITDFEKGLS